MGEAAKEAGGKPDNPLTLYLSIGAAILVAIGLTYNLAYFVVSDLNYLMLLDYTDFLYTPALILAPSLGMAIVVLTVRSFWQKSARSAVFDVAGSILIVALNISLNFGSRDEATLAFGAYAPLIFNLLLILSLGVCFAWIWFGLTELPHIGVALPLASLGFLSSVALYAAQQARDDLAADSFRDRLLLKDDKRLDQIHIARIVGKGVFFVSAAERDKLTFYKSDAYEGIERAVK